jgi:hypothetical protein
MQYAVKMGSGAVIYTYIVNFIKIGSDEQTHREHEGRISLLYFFKIRKVG